MLRIRNAQLQVFELRRIEQLVERLLQTLPERWPATATSLGEPGLRAFILTGIERCKRYGIDTEVEAVRYLDLMFRLGRDFDTSPAYPWAGEILGAAQLTSRGKLNILEFRARMELGEEAYQAMEAGRAATERT